MKQKDIALLIVVGVVSAVIAILSSSFLLNKLGSRELKAEVVDSISSEFNVPDDTYFNQNSLDPTQLIRIGDNSNQTPFQASE